MRKLDKLCRSYNLHHRSKVVVFRVPKSQYGYKYLVRYSHTGNWQDFDDQYHFDTVSDVNDFLVGLFR